MKLLLKTPFISLLFVALSAIVFLQCGDKTVVETGKYFYTDLAYYQIKNNNLLKCLIKHRGVDSCYCLDKYNEGGNPVPGDLTEDGDVPDTRLDCCPCQKDKISIRRKNDLQTSTTNEGRIIPNICCKCPNLFVLTSLDSIPPYFSFDNSKYRERGDDLNKLVVKEEVTISNTKYYQYSFPKDFSGDVRIKYRNTDLGSFTYRGGLVQSWCSND